MFAYLIRRVCGGFVTINLRAAVVFWHATVDPRPNDAHHWRRANDVQDETETPCRRPVHVPGYTSSGSYFLMASRRPETCARYCPMHQQSVRARSQTDLEA